MAKGAGILGLGYLGRPLAEKLYLAGWEVAAVKRRLTSDDINLPIALQCADFGQTAQHGKIFGRDWAEKNVWICLLPPTPFSAYDACLKSWCALAADYGIRHVVYASSTGVYGDRRRICDENSPPEPQTESAEKIEAAEQILLQSGIPNIDILRLGGLYCAERHPLHSIVRQGKAVKNADAPANMLHRHKAVAALYAAALSPDGIRIRNIIDGAQLAKREFYLGQAVSLGMQPPRFEAGDSGKTVCSLYRD